MDVSLPPVQEEPPERDWSLLPLDALASVFVSLSVVDVIMGAGLVCRSWLDAANVPDVWHVVFLDSFVMERDVFRAMAKVAVDRSDGQLRVFDVDGEYLTDELMQYILQRSPSLTTLSILCGLDVFSERVLDAIRDSPLLKLRYLELDDVNLTVGELATLLENCPALEVLRVCNCSSISEDDLHEVQAIFPGIQTLTIERDEIEFSYM